MEVMEIKEALNTVIMLSEAAKIEHTVEIDRIGKVVISKEYGAMQSMTGELKQITRDNISQCLNELLRESYESKVKRRISEMNFS